MVELVSEKSFNRPLVSVKEILSFIFKLILLLKKLIFLSWLTISLSNSAISS